MFGIRILPGSEVRSDPPCDYDYALVAPRMVLGRAFWVIEKVWDA